MTSSLSSFSPQLKCHLPDLTVVGLGKGAGGGRLCLAESSVWARVWCQELETESAKCKDMRVERWMGAGRARFGEKMLQERPETGLI
jgi:hypothetical protein